MNGGVRVIGILVAALMVVQLGGAVVGYRLFTDPPTQPPVHSDAIVVLGGEHDGREAFGIDLARAGFADTVLLSNPYPDDDPTMRAACQSSDRQVRIVCFTPRPSTTTGEALFTREQARAHHWSRVTVVSWRHHLFRAGVIFRQCLGIDVQLVAVPRTYHFSLGAWAFVYAYQFAGTTRAALTGCPPD